MKEDADIKYWNLDTKAVLINLNTSEEGLKTAEARTRLDRIGKNVVGEKKPRSAIHILIEQLKNWLILVLVAASLISFFIGENLEGIVIVTMVILSVIFGFIQEFKAEKVIQDLKKYISRKSKVLRDGKWIEIDTQELVPGDIVELLIGDKIPADIRLINSDDLLVDESVLTGESLPIEKSPDKIKEESNLPSKLKNMLFMGTSISQGKSKGVITKTGKDTFFGKTSTILEKAEPETDFQKQIRIFSLFLFRVIMIMTLFIFVSNTLLKKEIFESLLFALALAVGITPEMLPAIITVTLSQGAMGMAKKKVVVKRLISVEDLGNVDTLCMDKTGTLTRGIFSLEDYRNLDGARDDNLVLKGMICTAGIIERTQNVTSNPIDKAIWDSIFAQKIKNKLIKYELLDENEFDYNRKRMSVLYKRENNTILVVKGAFESLISVSSYAIINKKIVKIDSNIRKKISDIVDEYEDRSYRVITLAKKITKKTKSSPIDEKELTIIGFLLFKDPVKETTKEAVKQFVDLGVDLKILSGDSLKITENIAIEAGIKFNNKEIISGEYLDNINDDEFFNICKRTRLFARVSPEQKYKIVNTLNYEGHILGFLGDGVNDVPALRAADVGISVDTGAEIAKDASDIILLEKDLKVLSQGIIAGRKTFGNIMKYILNTISANYGNMFTVAASSVFIKFIPLLPSQILLNNFISDVPLLAVATDNVDDNFINKPKKWNINFIKKFMIYYGFVSTFFDLMLILPMLLIFKVDPVIFRTAWFVESSVSEMIVTFAIRTKMPFYKSKPSNWLLGLSLISIGFVFSLPFLGWNVFSFVSLPTNIWLLIIIDLVGYFMVTELVKKSFFAKFEKENN